MKTKLSLILSLGIGLLAPVLRAGTLVQFNLFAGVNFYIGEVDVELYEQDKPVTVSNFIHLVSVGAYGRGFLHRCEPGLILQGGGYSAVDPFSTNLIGPPYGGLFTNLNFGPITNEFKVGTFRSNTNGTIAMAKGSDPNSANSQFFFNLADNSAALDNTNNSGGFTVFGHVVGGSNALAPFYLLTKGNGLFNLVDTYGTNTPLTTAFTELPANFGGTNPPPYSELIYYTVNLLTLQAAVNHTNGAHQLTWTTVAGVTNNLEYATNLPPSWQVLFSTNGNGSTVSITDPVTNNTRRFYRVHVLF